MSETSILLLDPPFFSFLDETQKGLPLGLAYLAGTLKANGYNNVKILDADIGLSSAHRESGKNRNAEVEAFEQFESRVGNINDIAYQNVIDVIREEQPQILGISIRTAKFFISKQLVHRIKTEFPDITIVAGGPHTSSRPEDILERMAVDIVVRGEGEIAFLELVKALDNGLDYTDIMSLSYLKDGKVINNPMRPYVDNIDEIPLPERSCVIRSELMAPDDFGLLFSSRGCPYGCSFCDSRGTWTRKVRRMSHELLVQDILDIKEKYGTSFFSFQDDCLVTKESVAIDMCDTFKKAGLADLPRSEFRWWCEIHPNVITEKLVQNLKEAGCVAIAIGAESGSQRSLKQVTKGSTLDSIKRAADIIRNADISLTMFFIIGFPWETQEDILETIDFMEEVQPDNPALSVLTPLPGTPIFDYCQEHNLISPDNDYRAHFHQRADSFYNLKIPQQDAAGLIKTGFQRCADVMAHRKQQLLIDFFQNHLKTKLSEHYNFSIAIPEFSEHSDTRSVDGSAPRHLLIDQDWENQSIQLEIMNRDANIDDLDETAKAFITNAFLDKFPEYEHVNVCIRSS